MLLLIDNYDSFTYNLWHYFGELGFEPVIYRNDALSVAEAMALKPEGIIISPGPCNPDTAGICLELIKESAKEKMPLIGVCLGHQSIGQAFGGKVIRADKCVHGKVHNINHNQNGLFKNLKTPLKATRYHSLIVERKTLPDCLEVSAWLDDGMIMGLKHKELPIYGVQFHPESIASECGHQMLDNFLIETGIKKTKI
ncbi:MAG: aminodeoxychorismate/anthranilate synthase component II [Alphaproteobacteria bacterium]